MNEIFLKKVTGWIAIAALTLSISFTAAAKSPKHLLVVTVTEAFRHDSIPTAEKVLQKIANESDEFTVEFARTAEELDAKTSLAALGNYDGVIFANTSGELPLADKEVFIEWIRQGHAFIGMHAAADTLQEFPAYIEMVGANFVGHGPQGTVEALVGDKSHPATSFLGESYFVKDEIYLFDNYVRENVHLLLSLDKEPTTKTPGHYPISWNKKFGKGRVFYTSLGHRSDVWESYLYQQHILGGILWATGVEGGSAKPQSTAPAAKTGEFFDAFKFVFNGQNLDGWKPRNPDVESWTVENGMLVNRSSEESHGTDLITEETFRDFEIRLEYMVAPGSNSGVYLRGRYEIQILDDYSRHYATRTGNGSIYNFKAPKVFASRPAGEWNQLVASIVGDVVNVKLNGVVIHENARVPRATGSELDSNLDEPGPIMLQGDHGSIAFRNIRIKALW